MRFAWDREKEKANIDKHGISFDKAAELFSSGTDYLEIYDKDHSQHEDRFTAIGPVAGRIVVVVYTEWPEDTIRVISARPANRREIRLYRKHQG
ncbi:MAG TPA: BrnT family toxin [Planctomycetota bacterium]|nr:BrnT family toxin [Planctomycetota bacterium]